MWKLQVGTGEGQNAGQETFYDEFFSTKSNKAQLITAMERRETIISASDVLFTSAVSDHLLN